MVRGDVCVLRMVVFWSFCHEQDSERANPVWICNEYPLWQSTNTGCDLYSPSLRIRKRQRGVAASAPIFASEYAFCTIFWKSTRLSSWKFWNLAIFCKFCNICKIFAEFSRKLLIFKPIFSLKFWDCSGVKVCKSCRAWKMLSNAYFLAKFRFDTAENEPAKNLQNFAKFAKIC